MRSPVVWDYARQYTKNKNKVIGGIAMHRLPWLLGSGHHALLTDDHEIIDLAEYLSNYAHIQTQKVQKSLSTR
jgi:hypothetical protein